MEDVTLKNAEITTNQISNNEENNKTENPVEEGLISGYTFISVLVDLLDDEVLQIFLYTFPFFPLKISNICGSVCRSSVHRRPRPLPINGHWKIEICQGAD